MKKFFLLFAAAASLVLTSCEKDPVKPDNGGGQPQPPGAKLLKKLTETENGEVSIYTFTYDGNKRLTSFKNADNSENATITYDNAGNVTRVENREEGFHNIFTYTYNNGVPVSGTFKSYEVVGNDEELIEDDLMEY
ncbi:MAG TPA: hypothetical protein VHK69_03200, partial [Chitinophagaceae bacterium]|nr:hypothetical protein [Chitinophagaceae bacterium]